MTEEIIHQRANEIRADWNSMIDPLDLEEISDQKLVELEDKALIEAGIDIENFDESSERQQNVFWSTLEYLLLKNGANYYD